MHDFAYAAMRQACRQVTTKTCVDFFVLSVLANQAIAANYATCLLDKAPHATDDAAAQLVRLGCAKEYPGGMQAVPQGSGRTPSSYGTGFECLVAKGKETRSNLATSLISMSCSKLYDKPMQTDSSEARPVR